MNAESRNYQIGVIYGDGIGPEIVREAVKVLDAASAKFGFKLNYTQLYLGGSSIDRYGVPLTDEAIETAKAAYCSVFPLYLNPH